MQATGFTVVAEKLNFFRYLSHFRSVHRGSYFMQLRTTAVRKLLPESWGFMCPVHTPDGSPCGLLNHFTHACNVVASDVEDADAVAIRIVSVLEMLGMTRVTLAPPPPLPGSISASLDGRVIGHLPWARAPSAVARLREIKAHNLNLEVGGPETSRTEPGVPYHIEVCLLGHERGGPYPGLFLYTQQARMLRPVRQVKSGMIELLGTLEQYNMNIRCATPLSCLRLETCLTGSSWTR